MLWMASRSPASRPILLSSRRCYAIRRSFRARSTLVSSSGKFPASRRARPRSRRSISPLLVLRCCCASKASKPHRTTRRGLALTVGRLPAAAERIVAPMPGTVTRILAQPGAGLRRGAPLIVLEAMKMEHTLRAPADGRVKALKCAVGDFVQEGTELADFEAATAEMETGK